MRFFRSCVLIILLLCPLSALGQFANYKFTTPVNITAESIEHNRANNTFTASGNVELTEGTRSLTADYVFYNENTKDVLAKGNVVFIEGEDRVECDQLTYNLDTKQGTLENARIYMKQDNFYVTGEEMNKVGESRYRMTRGEFTTCGWDKPAWKFTATDVDITVEGYAKAKSARFHILDVPVFYFPWAIFPAKTERQSGFLIPKITLSSDNGVMLNNAYFWAISKDKDATFFVNYMQERGVNLGTEFRYWPREDLKGNWEAFVLKDSKYEHWRWYLKGKHEQKIYEDLQLKTNVHIVSDKDYLKDLSDLSAEKAESQLKSTAFIEKSFKRSLLTTELAYFRSLLVNSDNETFQYLPRMTFFTEYLPHLNNRMFTDISSDFTNFYRERGDKYSRLAFEPRIQLPYSIKGLNFLLSGTLIETAYLVGNSDVVRNNTAFRHTYHIQGDVNMQFLRNFNTDLFGIGEMQSLIRPQLQYNFIPKSSFRDMPNIDPFDRIYKTNSITYSFNHYLYGLRQGAQRELALFEISQTWGLSEDLGASTLYSGYGDRFSDVEARLSLFPMPNLTFTNQTIMSVHGDGLTTMRNGFVYNVPNQYHFGASHTYTRDLNHEAFFDIGAIYGKFEGAYQLRYSFKDHGWVETLYRVTYRPSCWAVTVSLTQARRPSDTRVNVIFSLGGLGEFGVL
ncbi:MAG TPA: LPS assembly protein LptD [Syntrophorhabdaceae bacterium]|nr:LPS assembly protein LptD [Syntrophorhabdaceae bacterium]